MHGPPNPAIVLAIAFTFIYRKKTAYARRRLVIPLHRSKLWGRSGALLVFSVFVFYFLISLYRFVYWGNPAGRAVMPFGWLPNLRSGVNEHYYYYYYYYMAAARVPSVEPVP